MSDVPTDMSHPSICIPRTWKTVTWMHVKEVFEDLFGQDSIQRVDVVKRGEGKDEYNKIFIHFTKWPDTPEAQNIRKVLLAGKSMKVVYDTPWYWKCFMNTAPRPRYNGGRKPYIELE